MTVTDKSFPKAFAVRFRELERWDPVSFERITWHWPTEDMAEIGSVLKLRKEKVDRSRFTFSDHHPITIHFDGSIDCREIDGYREYKMDLFYAHPGDIVVAKIDLKNGAVTTVPSDLENVVVTNHFAVYESDRSKLLPEYLQRIIQTSFFKSLLWRNKVGAEGRKEVKLVFFESLQIPLPPLSIQHAILERWDKAQNEIVARRQQLLSLEEQIETDFLSDLGLSMTVSAPLPKVFAVWWKDFDRWGVDVNQQATGQLSLAGGKYPVVSLADVIADLENGWSPKCLARPAEREEWGVLKMGAVSFGVFNERENKALPDRQTPRPEIEVTPGDFLISRANITRLVGACALVHQTRPRLMLCDKIFRAVWCNPSPVDKYYLDQILKIPHVRQQIENAVTGTSPTMKNITKPSLLALRFPLPPLALQRQLVAKIIDRRTEIGKEQEKIHSLIATIRQEVEEMILGTRPVPESEAIKREHV